MTYANKTFRAAFREVFRNYSLFFIGSGLTEDYFRGLFGEVLESLGSNPNPHCALFRKQDLDAGLIDHHFLHTKLNIIALYYDDKKDFYDGLYQSIDKLCEQIQSQSSKLYKLGFHVQGTPAPESNHDTPDLEIIAQELPAPKIGECCIISAGYEEEILLSNMGVQIIKAWGEAYNAGAFERLANSLVWRYGGTSIYAAVARNTYSNKSSYDSRDLTKISEAFIDALKATNGKYEVINTMLLAAGKSRIFPPIYSFIQMIRGLKIFKEKTQLRSKVKIFVVDPAVIFFIRRNSLEIEELLSCNDFKINIEVQDDDSVERFNMFIDPLKSLDGVSEYCSINSKCWDVKFFPAPFKGHHIHPDSQQALENLGIIPRSTIRYIKKP